MFFKKIVFNNKQGMHKLYISPNCPHCIDMMSIISKHGLDAQITNVNIQSCQPHEIRGLQSVPTIIAAVSGEQFVGTSAFGFIEDMMTIDAYDGTDSLSDINSIGNVSFGPDWKPGDSSEVSNTSTKDDIDALIQRRNQEFV